MSLFVIFVADKLREKRFGHENEKLMHVINKLIILIRTHNFSYLFFDGGMRDVRTYVEASGE